METRTYTQILELDDSTIANKASMCGINWANIRNLIIPQINMTFQTDIELSKKDKGRVKAWIQCKQDDNGNSYPLITFNNFNDGGISETYTGITAIHGKNNTKKTQLNINPVVQQPTQATNQLDTYNEFHSIFGTLPTVSINDVTYLNNKGLSMKEVPNTLDLRRGVDSYNKKFIAFPLVNVHNEIVGYQKIYDKKFKHGNKLKDKIVVFKPNTKNGSFAILGTITQHTKVIYLCEGLATALSVYESTKVPTIICLDLGNVHNVMQLFNSHELILAIDNDYNYIHDTLENLPHNAKIILPTLNDMGKCDYNDVYVKCGKQEVKKQLLFTHSYIKLNSKRLDINGFNSGVTLIKSTYETGKTYNCIQYVRKNSKLSVLYIAHLISLCDQAATKFAIKSYSKVKQVSNEKRMSICINSLYKIIKNNVVPIFDILILDEIEQLLERLANSRATDIRNKEMIFQVLEYLVKNCRQVICLDADLSKVTLDFIEAIRNGESFTIYDNSYVHKKTMYVYESAEEIIELTQEAVNANVPTLFCTNTLNRSETVFEQIQCSNKRVINSKTTSTDDVIEFLEDIDVHCQQDLLTICSPSISTGVSIESGHYKLNTGIFVHNVNTPLDVLQQLERDRRTLDKHIFISPYSNKIDNPNYSDATDFTLKMISANGEIVHRNNNYSKLVNNVNNKKIKLMSNFKGTLLDLAISKGYNIIMVEPKITPEEKTRIKNEQKQITETLEKERIEMIVTSNKIDDETYSNLRDLQIITEDERAEMSRFEMETFYNKDISEKLVRFDNKGKTRKQIKLLRLLKQNIDTIKDRQKWAFKDVFMEDVDYSYLRYTLYSKLFHHIGIDIDTMQVIKEQYSHSDALDFYNWVAKNKSAFSVVWSIPDESKFSANPFKYIGNLLQNCGLKQSRKYQKVNGETFTYYQVSQASIDSLVQYVNKSVEPGTETKKDVPVKTKNKFDVLNNSTQL